MENYRYLSIIKTVLDFQFPAIIIFFAQTRSGPRSRIDRIDDSPIFQITDYRNSVIFLFEIRIYEMFMIPDFQIPDRPLCRIFYIQ